MSTKGGGKISIKSKSKPKSRKSGNATGKTSPIIGPGGQKEPSINNKKNYNSDASSDVSSELSSIEDSPQPSKKKLKDNQ